MKGKSKTKEEGVTVINRGGDQGVNKRRGGVWCEGWAEAIKILKMKEPGPGGSIDACMKRG